MKTTDTTAFENKGQQKNQKTKIVDELAPNLAKQLKSIRPQKSMVRVKSLKPKRMSMIKGIKPLNK